MTPSALLLLAALPAAWAVDVVALPDLSTRASGTPITVPLHDASFPSDPRVKVTSAEAKVTGLIVREGVVYVTLDVEDGVQQVNLRVRYKTAAGAKADELVALRIPASPAAPISGTAEPPVSKPGTDTVQIRWTPPPSGQAPEARRFVARTSLGTLGPVTVSADGTASVQWRRPSGVEVPQMALITLVDTADPRRRGVLELPVQVSRSTTFNVEPNSKVSVTIGTETTAAKQASPAGTVAFDLALDPRVRKGVLTGRSPLGADIRQEVELPGEPDVVVLLAPLPLPVAAGVPALPATVAAASWAPGPASPVQLSASPGDLKPLPSSAFTAATLTVGQGADRISVNASGAAEDALTVDVTPGPLTVQATLEPTGTRDGTLSLTAVDPWQNPIADTVGVSVHDATFLSRPRRSGTTTSAKVRRGSGVERAVVSVEPPGSVADVPVAAVLPWLVPLDDERVVLRAVAVDGAGRAVAGVPLSVESNQLDGVPSMLTTNGYGMVSAVVQRTGELPRVTVGGGGHSGSAGLTAEDTVVVGGDAAWRAWHSQWMQAAPTLILEDPSLSAVAAVAPVDASPSAPAAAAPTDSSADAPPKSSPAPAKTRPAAGPGDTVSLRLTAALMGTSTTYSASQADPLVGPLSSDVAQDGFGGGGLHGGALFWLNDSWGLDADLRYVQATLDAEQTFPGVPPEDTATETASYDVASWEARVGARYRAALKGPLAAQVVGHVHRTSADLYLWSAGNVEPLNQPVLGGRLGGGLLVEKGPVFIDAQVGATAVPFVISRDASLRAQLALTDALAVHLGGELTARGMTYEVDGSEITLEDSTTAVFVGAAYLGR